MEEESKLSQDEWKEWLSMKATEDFMQIIENRISEGYELVKAIAMKGGTRDDTWDALCSLRGGIGELRSAVATAHELAGREYDAD